MRPPRRDRRGIPLRAVVPNAVTALALCSGLTAIRFAIAGQWGAALAAIMVAAVLDGMDGRIARMLNGASRFGAELDSLSDVVAFGVSPAIVLHLWALRYWPRFGWLFALAYAVCTALRLARFNASLDTVDQPHKSAGFLTGVPAPAGAGMLLLPIFLWLASGGQWDLLRDRVVAAPWAALVAFLMVSTVATFSWTSFRLRSHVRLWVLVAVAIVGGALLVAPWETLSVVILLYALSIPFSAASYARVKRQRAMSAQPKPDAAAAPPA
ncbi:MAG TPA: phosphatidylcholine/phosphatidylserine synthase [Allosphingosinicella sp.]|nr:phosphatidylcholine/phosphatidylserine synthase [Allosphingosinicella sp.]